MENSLKSALKNLKSHESIISAAFGILILLILSILLVYRFSPFETTSSKGEITQVAETTEVRSDIQIVEEAGQLEVISPAEVETSPENDPHEADAQTYKVKKGDSLWSIATEVFNDGYRWTEIAENNGLESPGLIYEGQELKIDQESAAVDHSHDESEDCASEDSEHVAETHEVKAGDSLWNIALEHYKDGQLWTEIYKINTHHISDPNLIEVGQVIQLP